MHALKTHILNTGRPQQQAAFDLLRKTKQRWVSKGFAIQASPRMGKFNPAAQAVIDDKKLHFCVITSKKTYAHAVDRNLLRRRLRAIALEILPLHANLDMDYMIVGRKEGLTLPFEDLKKDMLWCLRKLSLTQPNVIASPADAGRSNP